MSRALHNLIDRLNEQHAYRVELRRALREKRGGTMAPCEKRALTRAYRCGGQAAFMATWSRLMQRAQPRIRPRTNPTNSRGAAFRPAAPRRRRAQSRAGPPEAADPEPAPEPAAEFFSVYSLLEAEPAKTVLERFQKTRAWQLLDPHDRRQVIDHLYSGKADPTELIDAVFAEAALARGEHPGTGALWLGPELPGQRDGDPR